MMEQQEARKLALKVTFVVELGMVSMFCSMFSLLKNELKGRSKLNLDDNLDGFHVHSSPS